MKEKLLGKTLDELAQVASAEGLPRFAARQIADWIYVKRVTEIDRMTNLSKETRARLSEHYEVGRTMPEGALTSKDGTRKYLFPAVAATSEISGVAATSGISGAGESAAGRCIETMRIPDCGAGESAFRRCIETVMIPDCDDGGEMQRATVCVSSQIGCKMGCRFCMTGRGGFHGQLDTAQIISQFLSIDESEQLTNAVFMGMGEPLDNWTNVSKALEILTAPWGFGWSPKRITLSSVGVLPKLREYLDSSRCHLAISLHNPFAEERAEMMPSQKAWPVEDVLRMIRGYDFSGQRRVSFEYIMFSGWNDTPRHAAEIVRLLRGLECRINLIRFHAIPDFPLLPSGADRIESFKKRLNDEGITTTLRASRGEDVMAACGLLAGRGLTEGAKNGGAAV